jgi:glycosyltransferase involved in cell wall biosynthesis
MVKRPLKVLFLATRDWYNPSAAGGDILVWEYARYLASHGHSVTFVASSFPQASKEEVIDGITVVRLGGIHTLWLRTFLHYMKKCRGKYDVVVAEGLGGSRIPRWAPLYIKEPLITEWYQVHKPLFAAQYPAFITPLLNMLERFTALIHRNTIIQALAEEWRLAFTRLGFRYENIVVIPPSIRDDWLQDGCADKTQPTLIWLGKFRRYKCPHHAIIAMKKVVPNIPEAKLILAGRCEDEKYVKWLRDLIVTHNLKRNIQFEFNISERVKRQLLRSSRALVLPSSVEGFGIVILEANACCTPVIASSRVPEGAVKHLYNGLRYPFGNIAALAEAILQILKDDELYNNLSKNSVTFARRFSWSNVGAKFEQLLYKICDNQPMD